VKGARRPLRVRPEDLKYESGVDEHGGYITLAFTLPPGAFATVLLREIMKTDDETLGAARRGAGASGAESSEEGEDSSESESSEGSSSHPLGATSSVDDEDEGEN
jgi:tRNA pseudouridine13 synthase